MNLYPDQVEFVEEIRESFRSHQSVLAQAPTGFGKTVVAAYIAKAAAAKNKRVYFAVHRKNLITQTQKTFFDWGVPHGVIAAGKTPALEEAVQVVSIQTIVRRLGEVPRCDLLVVDECHLACSPTWSEVLRHFSELGAKTLGNTATPARLDGKPLAEHFDHMVLGPTVRSLMDNGRLSNYKLFAPSHLDFSSVRTKMGEYVTSDLEELLDRNTVVGDAITHYKQLMPGKRAIAFCVSVRHSKHVAELFCAAGIPARHIDGETSDEDRRQAISDFASGRILVLSNVELITTGFDLSAQVGREVPVEGAIMLRPTQSVTLWLQMVGRVLRRKDEPAIIADHVNGSLRHGLPDDDREWSLEGRKKGRRANFELQGPDLRTCEKCFAMFRVANVCPHCGQAVEQKSMMPDEEAGELVEVDPEEHRKLRPKTQKQLAEGRQRGLQALTEYAIRNDYKTGWAARRHALRTRGNLDKLRLEEATIRGELAS